MTVAKAKPLRRAWRLLLVKPLLATLLLVLLVGGCSLGMRKLANDWHPKQAPHCTSSRKAPITDAVFAGSAGAGSVGAALMYGRDPCDSERCKTAALAIGLGLIVAVVPTLIIVGRRGMRRAKKCRKAKRQHQQWLSGQRRLGPGGI